MEETVKAEEAIKEHLLYKRITSWDEERIVLEDGTTLDVECFEQDCCAYGSGIWSNVKLDAVITDIKLEDVKTDSDSYSCESWTTAKIMIYHNQNIIAQNDMDTNNGNAGYYYSVTGLLVTLPDNTKLKGFEIDCF